MKCKICKNYSPQYGEGLILNKYHVKFYKCNDCGFIQTESPFWLNESYEEAITKSDVGLISRNIEMAEFTKLFIISSFNPKDRFVDYGGGFGIFARIMRDWGFDYYRYDPYCKNLFSDIFDANKKSKYGLLSAWEVFEHLINPLESIEDMLSFSQNILFSTKLLPVIPKTIGDWWYYGLDHGQHISFYSIKTIEKIAQKFNLRFHFSKNSIHFIGKDELNKLIVNILISKRLKIFRKILFKRQLNSLLEKDYFLVTGKNLL